MKPFAYVRPSTREEAQALLSKSARPKGGGMDLLDLAKNGVSTPGTMVDLGDVEDMKRIARGDHGELMVGGAVTLARIAASPETRELCPALADAAAEAATPQVRNVATLAGNILQRPRCAYFRDPFFPCRKRGGDACPSMEGDHREGAVFGNGICCAVHPSNLAAVLVAARAKLRILRGWDEEEKEPLWRVPAADEGFFVAPEEDPLREARMDAGELLWDAIVPEARASAYVEVNQKVSFDWAAASCAAVLDVRDGKVRECRIVLGAVAPVPLRVEAAETALRGKIPDARNAEAAAAAAVTGATPLRDNAHKVHLAKVVVKRAILKAAERAG